MMEDFAEYSWNYVCGWDEVADGFNGVIVSGTDGVAGAPCATCDDSTSVSGVVDLTFLLP